MIFYATMKNSGITYSLDLPGEDPLVLVDGTKIRQVFLHLVKNAIEAMPAGGNLHVQVFHNQESICVNFTDSGPGISESHLKRVSDPFFTTKTYGTGMGLTLVEHIISLHNARFTLRHSATGGMIATVSLPRH